MTLTRQILLILVALLITTSLCAQPSKKLVFTTTEPTTDAVHVYFELLKQAYDELGYEIELRKLPGKRGFAYTDDGHVDGLVITTNRISLLYKNIIVVDVPLTRIELTAFSINPKIKIDGVNSLRPYRVGVLRGYPATKRLTQKMDYQIVNSYESLFSILQHGRVDVVLVIKTEAQRYLAANPRFKDIKALEPSLFQLPVYHCLNKKHHRLAQQVAPVIEELIKARRLEALYETYLKNPEAPDLHPDP